MRNIVVVVALILSLILAFIVPSSFVTKLADALILPINMVFDIPYFLLPIIVPMLIALSLYTIVTKNYQKFNCLYCWLIALIILGLVGIEIEVLFASTAFFRTAEWISMYAILIILLVSAAALCFIYRKNDVRYYFIIIGAILLFAIARTLAFILLQ